MTPGVRTAAPSQPPTYPATNPFSASANAPNPAAKISFSTFKQSFATTTNYLRRRFSSGDLSGELEDQVGAPPGGDGGPGRVDAMAQPPPEGGGGDLSLNLRPSSATSAPSSPARTVTSFLSRGTSLTGGASKNVPYAKDRHLTLLVVDDAHTDWAKYFRGRKVHGDWDVRVEQAEFGDISLWASTETGVTVSMGAVRQGTKVVRSFRPDFLLVRQHVRDARRDHRPLLLGLRFGGVPSVNSLHSLYNFQDKPWVVSIGSKIGREGCGHHVCCNLRTPFI